MYKKFIYNNIHYVAHCSSDKDFQIFRTNPSGEIQDYLDLYSSKCICDEEHINTEIRKFCNSIVIPSNEFVIVCWPDYQDLMDKYGFEKNYFSVTAPPDGELEKEFGTNNLAIRKSWYEKIKLEETLRTNKVY